MGAKFGSATMTSWPRASRPRATHSLSVEASITMRARGRVASTAAKCSGSVPDALLDHLTPFGEDIDLAVPLVDVDANMVHGWPLPSAALTADCSCGALCHHVKREASRFIPSSLRLRTQGERVGAFFQFVPVDVVEGVPPARSLGRFEERLARPVEFLVQGRGNHAVSLAPARRWISASRSPSVSTCDSSSSGI